MSDEFELMLLKAYWYPYLNSPKEILLLHSDVGGLVLFIEFKELERVGEKHNIQPKMIMGG